MIIRRFERIKRFLHCNGNEKIDKDFPDKLFKIGSWLLILSRCWTPFESFYNLLWNLLIDALKEKSHLLAPTELQCIDEQMVPFKVWSTLKQYHPHKLKKWGYKLYVLTNPDGLIYDFEVHTGTIDIYPDQPDLQASGNIVMKLLANIPRPKGHRLLIDNWETSVPLATTLMNQGIASRLRNCIMPSDKDMKKEARGTIAVKMC